MDKKKLGHKIVLEKDLTPVLNKFVEVQKAFLDLHQESFKSLVKSLKLAFFSLLFLILLFEYTDFFASLVVEPIKYIWNLYNKASIDTQLLVVTAVVTGVLGYIIGKKKT